MMLSANTIFREEDFYEDQSEQKAQTLGPRRNMCSGISDRRIHAGA